MKKLIDHLKRIARENEDNFDFNIKIEVFRNEIRYLFEAEETYDNHNFISIVFTEFDKFLEYIEREEYLGILKRACKEWNYKYVD